MGEEVKIHGKKVKEKHLVMYGIMASNIIPLSTRDEAILIISIRMGASNFT